LLSTRRAALFARSPFGKSDEAVQEVEQARVLSHSDRSRDSVHRSSLLVPELPGASVEISFLNHFLLKRVIAMSVAGSRRSIPRVGRSRRGFNPWQNHASTGSLYPAWSPDPSRHTWSSSSRRRTWEFPCRPMARGSRPDISLFTVIRVGAPDIAAVSTDTRRSGLATKADDGPARNWPPAADTHGVGAPVIRDRGALVARGATES
jgi:hypothetical protein